MIKYTLRLSILKIIIKAISSDTPLHAPLYNIIIIFDTVVKWEQNFKHTKIINSTVSPSCHFGMRHRGVAAANPMRSAYVDGSKRENSSF